jgi:hypothetical protein
MLSLLPGWGRRVMDKSAGTPQGERHLVLAEAMRAEFTSATDRITAALATATDPSKREELHLAHARLRAELVVMGETLIEVGSIGAGDPAAISGRLATLEARWRETGNPVFVWRALDLLLDVKGAGAEALPPWCVEYLATAARNLARVDERTPRRKAKERQRFGNLVAAALLLTRRGSNGFIAARREDQRVEVARIAGLIRKFGFSAARANAEASRLIRVGEQRAQQRNVARGRAALKGGKPEG